jgi:hypothetical protein
MKRLLLLLFTNKEQMERGKEKKRLRVCSIDEQASKCSVAFILIYSLSISMHGIHLTNTFLYLFLNPFLPFAFLSFLLSRPLPSSLLAPQTSPSTAQSASLTSSALNHSKRIASSSCASTTRTRSFKRSSLLMSFARLRVSTRSKALLSVS